MVLFVAQNFVLETFARLASGATHARASRSMRWVRAALALVWLLSSIVALGAAALAQHVPTRAAPHGPATAATCGSDSATSDSAVRAKSEMDNAGAASSAPADAAAAPQQEEGERAAGLVRWGNVRYHA